jgi:hypothetical protein
MSLFEPILDDSAWHGAVKKMRELRETIYRKENAGKSLS